MSGQRTALEWAALSAVCTTDIAAVARGIGWKDFYARRSWGCSLGPDEPRRENRGNHTTIGDLAALAPAIRAHCDAGGSDLAAYRVFEEVKADVVARGISALTIDDAPSSPDAQLSLFPLPLEAAS